MRGQGFFQDSLNIAPDLRVDALQGGDKIDQKPG